MTDKVNFIFGRIGSDGIQLVCAFSKGRVKQPIVFLLVHLGYKQHLMSSGVWERLPQAAFALDTYREERWFQSHDGGVDGDGYGQRVGKVVDVPVRVDPEPVGDDASSEAAQGAAGLQSRHVLAL